MRKMQITAYKKNASASTNSTMSLIRWSTGALELKETLIGQARLIPHRHRARGVDFSSALLPLPWTVVHVLDERSPLYGATPDSLAASDAEIIAILEGTDEVRRLECLRP